MIVEEAPLKIATLFPSPENSSSNYYAKRVREILLQILPENSVNDKKKFLAELPLVKCISNGGVFSFFCIFRYRANAFKFFFDLVSQWLVPGVRLNVVLVHALDFRLPDFSDDVITVCEVVVQVDDPEIISLIHRNFPLLQTEAALGVDSEYYARKILEIKGASPDQKTSMIHQRIATLILRMPTVFSSDVFTEMQHILVLCDDDFKGQRTVVHLSRFISIYYLMRKNLLDWIRESTGKRRVLVKLFRASVNFPQGKKQVLSLMVSLNFLREKEVFEQRHLLTAIKKYIPDAELIDQTFFSSRKGDEPIVRIYVEFEKNDGSSFSADEIRILNTQLPDDLQHHIGRHMLPVFMPRNEEEVMRNILGLGNQLKYLRDIPQVFISFDEQSDRNLFFTVILLRVIRGPHESIQEMIKSNGLSLKYIHDRVSTVGFLKKKFPKEATVFRVKFPKDNFIRGDHSIDLYKARQYLVNELTRALGEFRDFNGGMIAKQNELLAKLKHQLNLEKIRYNEIHLDTFFYSLVPFIMRTLLGVEELMNLYMMILQQKDEGISKTQKHRLKWSVKGDYVYLVALARQRPALDEVIRLLSKPLVGETSLVHGTLRTAEFILNGYIYRFTESYKQAQFLSFLQANIS